MLDARTVGRDALLDRIVARIGAAARTGNLGHTLLIGPRGAGKTHALAVALHRARELAEAGALGVVAVPEDNVGVVSYADLLGFVAGALGVEAVGLGRGQPDVGALETAIGAALGTRVLVLVVENLDRLFAKLGTAGQRDLRAWVETARNVLLVASTPLLFDEVRDRTKPWFGSFAIEHLDELSLAEGTDLITRLRPDDPTLVGFVGTPTGQARLAALHQLTGGSPRLWTILADVVTIDLLDELAPAVERLLEELVGYYQQRLWDLGPNEEQVVAALATGPVSRTATDLAAELGLDQRIVGTTLGRLAESRWVRGRKVAGTDQRATWYELREPLLRHHFQYRTGGNDLLSLVVEMLRHWYDPAARERHLGLVAPASAAERYLGASLNLDRPSGYDHGYNAQRPEDLLLQARRWINDPGATAGFGEAGMVIEGVLDRLGHGSGCRALPAELAAVADAATAAAGEQAPDRPVPTRIAAALDGAASAAGGRLGQVLEWCAASWAIPAAPVRAEARLAALLGRPADDDDLLHLAVRHDLAYLHGDRDPERGLRELDAVLEARQRLQGDRHPDVLTARSNQAWCTGETGDVAGALRLFREVLADRVEVLGPAHPNTLSTMHEVAHYTGQTGDAAGALRLFRELLADRVEVLGPAHPNTLSTMHEVAYYTGETGDAAGALRLFREVLADRVEVLGPAHPGMLTMRHEVAYYTGETGDAAGALRLFREVLADRVEVLGPAHPGTLATRHGVAYYTGEAGDAAGALRLCLDLEADLARAPDALDKLRRASRWNLARTVALVLRSGASGGLPVGERHGLVGDLLDAAEGSELALARLPSELRPLVQISAQPPPAGAPRRR